MALSLIPQTADANAHWQKKSYDVFLFVSIICFCAYKKGFLLANLGDFPYIFRGVYSVNAMPKTEARYIHLRYQYDTDKLGLNGRKPVFWASEQ